VFRNFFSGVATLGRGLRFWITSPRVMLLGAIPALIVGLVYLALVVLFVSNLDAVVAWATPFANDLEPSLRALIRALAGIALVGIVVIIYVYTYTAVTLAVGDVFYERIWRRVELTLGNAPDDVDDGFWRSVARGIGNAVRLFLITVLVGIALAVATLIPVVGQTVVPVLGAFFGGWFLTLELSGFAFDARRLRLRDRRRVLGETRAKTLGFGVATYLLFLIPGAAVVVMPAAVAGATMLSREAIQRNATTLRAGS
jgi:CysZ protein